MIQTVGEKAMFVDLLKQPWFAVSPSPWSLAFYALMAAIGSQLLIHRVHYKRWPRLLAFIDALFLLGMIVFIQDSIWLVCNTVKWIIPLYSYTANFWNYYVRFPQNILGAMLMLLLTWGLWRLKVVSIKIKTFLVFVCITVFTFLVFALAPNQAWTDWIFAVSHGFPDQVILEAFLISHVGYKALIALAFLSLFSKIEDNSTTLLKEVEQKTGEED
jgi:hypothetical protein